MNHAAGLALVMSLLAGPALAAEQENTLASIISEVFSASGSKAQITGWSRDCLSKVLAPADPALIESYDPDLGIVTAANGTTFGSRHSERRLRSTVTVRAWEGSFRIVHSNIEQQVSAGRWSRVGAYSDATLLKAKLDDQSAAIASCVRMAAGNR